MRLFVIADSSKRKAKPIGVLAWERDAEEPRGRFTLEVCSSCDEASLPLSLSFCARREYGRATPEESAKWARSRIVPENRQNIAEVLLANGLSEYDPVSLLAACQGRSSDDDLLVYEVDVPRGFDTAQPMADRVVNAVRRRRMGSKISYAFVSLEDSADAANAAGASAADAVGAGSAGADAIEASAVAGAAEALPTATQRIGALIRAERKAQGLTQKQLAARAGITQTVLSRTESGAGNPTLSLLEDIAAALDTQLDVSLSDGQ